MNIETIRSQFPIYSRPVNGKELIYLDNGATTLKPQRVVDKVVDYLGYSSANVHRGVYYLSEKATHDFEAVRDLVKDFITARTREEIIFTKGTTESINLIANCLARKGLKAGDEVIITEMEHHSNIVPWQMLRDYYGIVLKVVPITDSGEVELEVYKNLLNSKTKLVSFVHISNSLGTVNPIEEMIQMAKSVDALTLVDAAQSIAHQAIQVQNLDCDFLAFSGHKMYGPTGVGVLYGKREVLNSLPPFLGGGDMIASVSFEKTTYNSLPYKFEAGTPAIAEVIGLGEAIKFLKNLDFNDIHRHEQSLLRHTHESLADVPGLKFYGTAKNKAAIVSFTLNEIHPHDIGSLLDQYGICIRVGHHCTEPVMRRYKIPATARASFAIYNKLEEVDALKKGLLKVVEVFQ